MYAVKEHKLLDITFAAGVEKLDKEEREVTILIIITLPCCFGLAIIQLAIVRYGKMYGVLPLITEFADSTA